MSEVKRALVTGSSRGLGLEWVSQLLASGYEVIAVTRKYSSDLKKLESEGTHAARLKVLCADLSTDQGLVSLVQNLPGSLDLLVNNAGVYLDGDSDFKDLNFQDVEETFRINVLLPMKVTRACLPALEKSKNPKVLNVTSLMGSIADNTSGGSYAYRMSKAALNMFNKSFTIDFPKIVSLVVHPGWVKTEMGGAHAPVDTQTSVQGMLSLVERAGLAASGRFYDYEGDELPW